MPRTLALFALSLFVSLTLTAVATLIARPEARSALFEVASRCGSARDEKEILP